jgi:hypothetical protein
MNVASLAASARARPANSVAVAVPSHARDGIRKFEIRASLSSRVRVMVSENMGWVSPSLARAFSTVSSSCRTRAEPAGNVGNQGRCLGFGVWVRAADGVMHCLCHPGDVARPLVQILRRRVCGLVTCKPIL